MLAPRLLVALYSCYNTNLFEGAQDPESLPLCFRVTAAMHSLAQLPDVAYVAPDDCPLELSADRMALRNRKNLSPASWRIGARPLQEIAARTISNHLSIFDLTGLPSHLKSLILKALIRSDKALEHLDTLLDEDITELDLSNAATLPGPWVPRFAVCTSLRRLDLRGCLEARLRCWLFIISISVQWPPHFSRP